MRKTATVTIPSDGGRDAGKRYFLTEMPCAQIEKWSLKLFLALLKAGVDVPDEIIQQGTAGLAAFGINNLAGLSFQDAEPLLDEMMQCVSFVPDARHPEVVRPLFEDDIEELGTRFKLRMEVAKLHISFSKPGDASTPPASMSSGIPSKAAKTSHSR